MGADEYIELVGLFASNVRFDHKTKVYLACRKEDPPTVGKSQTRVEDDENEKSRPLFLFWTHEFSMGGDVSFMLEFAAELVAAGYRVVIESPVDGVLPQDLYPPHAFKARVNPRLGKILSVRKGEKVDPMEAIDDLPQYVICFSSLWSSFFSQLSRAHSGVKFVWYFYHPLTCSQPQDLALYPKSFKPVDTCL